MCGQLANLAPNMDLGDVDLILCSAALGKSLKGKFIKEHINFKSLCIQKDFCVAILGLLASRFQMLGWNSQPRLMWSAWGN